VKKLKLKNGKKTKQSKKKKNKKQKTKNKQTRKEKKNKKFIYINKIHSLFYGSMCFTIFK